MKASRGEIDSTQTGGPHLDLPADYRKYRISPNKGNAGNLPSIGQGFLPHLASMQRDHVQHMSDRSLAL